MIDYPLCKLLQKMKLLLHSVLLCIFIINAPLSLSCLYFNYVLILSDVIVLTLVLLSNILFNF